MEVILRLIPYYFGEVFGPLNGIKHLPVEHGIPTLDQFLQMYCDQLGIDNVPNLPFHVAFSMFRMAGILQGVAKRALAGNASDSKAKFVGGFATLFADTACKLIEETQEV